MHDDLTAQDIEMMQKELDHRKLELMPELIEEVKRTRAFGDLSEKFEYKAAFTGAFIGMCCQDVSGRGKWAYFDSFEYKPLL